MLPFVQEIHALLLDIFDELVFVDNFCFLIRILNLDINHL